MSAVNVDRRKGRVFSEEDLGLIRDVVETCSGLSRTELALTVCELLEWRRPNGRLKARECREVLEDLARCGELELPDKRVGRRPGRGTTVPRTQAGEAREPVIGSVRDVEPVLVELVEEKAQQELFRELIGRYHYLGYRVPFGAQIRYLVCVSRPEAAVVGAVQFSSPAWRMSARDRWIGWNDAQRGRNLQRVVSNSRLLFVPWVRVKNLASKVLSVVVNRLVHDWPRRYGVSPLLLETMVDPTRYRGSCYRAANWIEVGSTAGRGRMDKGHERHGLSPKTVFVYPLTRDAARRLCEGC